MSLNITDSNSVNFNEYFLETPDCTEESRKDETCLQLKMKNNYIKLEKSLNNKNDSLSM